METLFSTKSMHHVTEANINFYATPFVHPKRIMPEHDFIYVLQGEWKIGQNDEQFGLKKDSLLILTGGNTHFGVSPCLPGTKTMYFHVSRNKGEALLPTAESPTSDHIYVDTLINAANHKGIKKIFAEIINEKLSGNQRKADIYFELLLCELAENGRYCEGVGIATKLKSIIHSNPEKFFSNKELAEMTNVSVKTAETKFKSVQGKTIHQYMLEFKIKEAISYFDIFPEISIKEIAYNLGFYDEYHFSKQFKKIIGISPSNYKKQQP